MHRCILNQVLQFKSVRHTFLCAESIGVFLCIEAKAIGLIPQVYAVDVKEDGRQSLKNIRFSATVAPRKTIWVKLKSFFKVPLSQKLHLEAGIETSERNV